MDRYTVTAVVTKDVRHPATLSRDRGRGLLSVSAELESGDKIETRGSYVELRDDKGLVMRLGPNSEVEHSIEAPGGARIHALTRPTLVVFGEVYKFRYYVKPIEIYSCGKYSTSCYFCPHSFYARNIDGERDAFYGIAGDTPIWEWDEDNESFDIVTLKEGQKVVLRHDETRPMRDRYTVETTVPIDPDEWDYIALNFMSGRRWMTGDGVIAARSITG